MVSSSTCVMISFFIFFSVLLSTCSGGDDSEAMLKLASALTPSPFDMSLVNTTANFFCAWKGVKCGPSSRVSAIVLDDRNLSGTLPSDLSALSQLQTLSFQRNSLTGPLPSLSNLSLLEDLFLGDNNFSDIPLSFFQGLPSLRILSLSFNVNLAPWSLPTDLAQCVQLTAFVASETNLVGTIPDVFSSLPSLRSLKLSYNSLSGTLPISFGNSAIQILLLNNQETKLSGTLQVLSSMTDLTQVWLHGNWFTGSIPDLSNCELLFDLQLRDNLLTGVVPASLISLPALQNVSLSSNMLQGPVPKFPSDMSVDIIGNNFCVNVAGIQCHPQVTTLLSIAGTFEYPIILSTSWKGNNACQWKFVGCDEQNMIAMVNLATLNLSGSISPGFVDLVYLRHLRLNDNNLTGPIPDSLTNLTELQLLDVSNNNLSGKVPRFPFSVTLRTGGNPLLGMESNSPIAGNGDNKGSPFITIVVVVVVVVAFIIFLVILSFVLIKRKIVKKRHRKSEEVNDLEKADGYYRVVSEMQGNGNHCDCKNVMISIEVLRYATDNFSENNILGKGGFGVVYKGELDDGTKIAVKRMANKTTDANVTNDFQAEIQVLTRVWHRRLVSLLGYCIDGNEKFLVYEFMPQGTLAQRLFEWRERRFPPLTWTQRITIALDVAQGIEYLHSLAQQSFIHRDLKSSNILLGDDMRAKIADFGLVKNVPNEKNSLETRVAGTFGYLAPEYATTGRVTRKVDVYAFGAILMEMITGRKALDEKGSDEEWMSMHLVTWFRNVLNKDEEILKAIDKTLTAEDRLVSIRKVAELAGHCTAPQSCERPDMCNVVNILVPLVVEQWKPPIREKEETPDISDSFSEIEL